MKRVAQRHGVSADWESLRRWAIERRGLFWREMLEFAGVQPMTPASRTMVGEGMQGTKWFPDMRLNYAQHLLRFDDDRIAIRFENETGGLREISYRQLRREVAGLAKAFQRMGLTKGDRVAAFMPNLPETVMAMLAAASLGAIWSSCSPDFGIEGVLDRFGQIEPKVLVTADGYFYNGKTFDSLERASRICAQLGGLERVIVVPYVSQRPDLSGLPSAVRWGEFFEATDTIPTFEPVPFDHPLFIMYSSGTTGIPKCIVHGHGGTLLQHMKELMLHCELRRDDVVFYFTTCGWMMWNWLVSSLGVGATVSLYDGNPMYPEPGRLWKLAQEAGISVFGTSPKYVSACRNSNLQPGEQFDLSRLRCVLSTGSPLSVEQFEWVYENVKEDLQLSSISGGTDIISCFMLGNPILPVYAGEIQCTGLGMNVHAVNDDGHPVIGEKGELVCASPFPSQPVYFWNDPDGTKYRSAYFEHFPGIWRHGDLIEITEHGGVIVYGRSDATLNPGGVRIGTGEIYRIVEGIGEIADSVVVPKRVENDVEVCLFVVLREGIALTEELTKIIRRSIADGATKRHVPRHIRQVTAIPHTISGKKVEMAVTQMIHGEPVKNRDALANPDALDQFANILT